jgi:hypothetical protein
MPVPLQPSLTIRARLDLLEEAVRAAPLHGITYAEASELLASKLNQHLSLDALGYTLCRWASCHNLVRHAGRIRLHADLVVEILEAKHRSEKLQEKLAEEKLNPSPSARTALEFRERRKVG